MALSLEGFGGGPFAVTVPPTCGAGGPLPAGTVPSLAFPLLRELAA